MKNYNKSFKVEITANMIADKMMTSLDPKLSNTRREAFVDCIVGPMCSNDNSNGLKHLYYGLFELDMDAPLFKESDELICSHTHYGWTLVKNKDEDQVEAKYERERIAIGPCTLIGFDPYRSSAKYEIEYEIVDSKGRTSRETIWIDESELELASDHVEEATGE